MTKAGELFKKLYDLKVEREKMYKLLSINISKIECALIKLGYSVDTRSTQYGSKIYKNNNQ